MLLNLCMHLARPPRFQRIKAPSKRELEDLVQSISQRVGRCLERQGLLEQDTESAWLDLDPAEDTDAMPLIQASSISYRIAVGPQQGRKAFMIRTIRPLDRPDPGLERVAKANGFSLHAGVSCEGHERNKRERLCRYIARPAVAIPRLSLSSTGKVVYSLKTPYRDGTTQRGLHRFASGRYRPVGFPPGCAPGPAQHSALPERRCTGFSACTATLLRGSILRTTRPGWRLAKSRALPAHASTAPSGFRCPVFVAQRARHAAGKPVAAGQ